MAMAMVVIRSTMHIALAIDICIIIRTLSAIITSILRRHIVLRCIIVILVMPLTATAR